MQDGWYAERVICCVGDMQSGPNAERDMQCWRPLASIPASMTTSMLATMPASMPASMPGSASFGKGLSVLSMSSRVVEASVQGVNINPIST